MVRLQKKIWFGLLVQKRTEVILQNNMQMVVIQKYGLEIQLLDLGHPKNKKQTQISSQNFKFK
jgi:hypothetical protein